MKRHAGIIVLCAAMLGGGVGLAAELLGSPVPEIRKNFNHLLATNTCPRCDLRGVVLNRIDLFGADLSGANLAGAQLGHACLAGANLRNANLRGAWLGGADLSGTDMTGADIEGTNFTLNNSPPAMATDDNGSSTGKQAAEAAASTVNSVLDELFAQPSISSPPIQESALVGPTGEPVPPLSGMPSFAGPVLIPPQRSVDEIPVIETMPVQPPKRAAKPRFWERIWLDSAEKNERKKTAPTDGNHQHIPAEQNELVAAPSSDDSSRGTAVVAQRTVR